MNPFLCWLNLIGQKIHPLGMTRSFSQLQSEAVEPSHIKAKLFITKNFVLPVTHSCIWGATFWRSHFHNKEKSVFKLKVNVNSCQGHLHTLGHSIVGGSVRCLVDLIKCKAASFLQRCRFSVCHCFSPSLILSFLLSLSDTAQPV